jgi:hypothetical protein
VVTNDVVRIRGASNIFEFCFKGVVQYTNHNIKLKKDGSVASAVTGASMLWWQSTPVLEFGYIL